jgi:salicylate hydroxylase
MTKVIVIGAGIGGVAAALALRRAGIDVEIYEQAPKHRNVGAAITITPNAFRVLEGLGVGDEIKKTGYCPPRRLNRKWDTGEILGTIELGDAALGRFGAPLLQLLRADLINALLASLPPRLIHFDKKLVTLDHRKSCVDVEFEDGTRATADAVIGADGIHSTVREILLGPDKPRFTGIVGYRFIVPAERLSQFDLTPFTKWFGPRRESEFLTSLTSAKGDFYVFASIHQPEWRDETWSMNGNSSHIRGHFEGYAEEVQSMLSVCGEALKTAIYVRDPMPRWSQGHVTLLGDACHPMTPFMAQGAAMALEDAIVLSRCLESRNTGAALDSYERTRRTRTAEIQLSSQQNQWPQKPVDVDWVYGYDAWNVSLSV